MYKQPLEGGSSQQSIPRYTARQELLTRLGLYAFVLGFGAWSLLLVLVLIEDIGNCLKLGCSALLPMRLRYTSAEMPVHFHIGFDLFVLLVTVIGFILGYNDLTERLREIRAWREFEATMQRIRAGDAVTCSKDATHSLTWGRQQGHAAQVAVPLLLTCLTACRIGNPRCWRLR